MANADVDFLLDCLMQLMESNHRFVQNLHGKRLIEKHRIEWLFRELQFLGMFLKDSEKCTGQQQVKNIARTIRSLTFATEDFIDLLVLKNAMDIVGGFPNKMEEFIVQDEYGGTPEDSLEKFGGPWPRKSIFGTPWSSNMKTAVKTPFYKKMGNVLREMESEHDDVAGMQPPFHEKIGNVLREMEPDHDDVAGMTRQCFGCISEEIDAIKKEVVQIYKEKKYGIGASQTEESSQAGTSKIWGSPVVEEDTIVGIDDEKMAMIDQLTGDHGRQLKVVSIVGMPGLGKTALARLVYNDPFIVYHFYVRAWTFVSQVYRKRDLLVDILCSGFHLRDEISQMSDDILGEELYKRLKGKKYLIIFDDIWDVRAWNRVKTYFPNDHNGSRMIFTSRLGVVALGAKPHYLRFLNEDESWDLLQNKIFKKESCPQELIEIGKQIAKKCQGLPLAILVISGLLTKGNKTPKWWKHVADSVSSYIVNDPEKYMDTLALSYDYLPLYLKWCFLYFGTFPEDYEIHAWKLIWLWIAEGLISRHEQRSFEEVAEDYLLDLIDRSLVIVSKIGSNGRIKTCRIHDLQRDLCLRKASEVNFLR